VPSFVGSQWWCYGVSIFRFFAGLFSDASLLLSKPCLPLFQLMDPTLIIIAVLFIAPLFWKPTRKAVGLLNIIVGVILTLTGLGAVVGIPMIFIGGICMFV